MSRAKYTYAQQVCIRSAGRVMQHTKMIQPGARVGIAVSGGVDSWALLRVMQIRQGIVPFKFDIVPLHLNPGFDDKSHEPLVEWLEANGIEGKVELTDHGPRAHSEENRRKSPCFYCAMLRRKRLFEMCNENGLTHLAFGHNAEDLVGNFFMNLMQSGRVAGMSMNEPFFKGLLQVIRPLLMVEKEYIVKAVEQWKLPVWSNPCPSAGKTRRSAVHDEINALCGGRKPTKKNIYNGIARWQFEQNVQKIDAAELQQQFDLGDKE